MTRRHLDQAAIRQALQELGRRLDDVGIQGDLFLVGGAAMALAYDGRRFTQDVDAIFEPKMRIYELAVDIARDLDLPLDWLNDGVKAFLVEDPKVGPVFDFNGLRVQAASPELMLALKVRAARLGEDDEDLRSLVDLLGLASVDDVLELAAGIIGERHLTPRSQFFVQQVLQDDLPAE